MEPAVVIDGIGGSCPTQAEGTVEGLPFYFRYRHGLWQFALATTPDGDPLAVSSYPHPGAERGFLRTGVLGGAWDGYLPEDEVVRLIHRCAAEWYAERLVEEGDPPSAEQRLEEVNRWLITAYMDATRSLRFTEEQFPGTRAGDFQRGVLNALACGLRLLRGQEGRTWPSAEEEIDGC